jgi:hypothetical protein
VNTARHVFGGVSSTAAPCPVVVLRQVQQGFLAVYTLLVQTQPKRSPECVWKNVVMFPASTNLPFQAWQEPCVLSCLSGV